MERYALARTNPIRTRKDSLLQHGPVFTVPLCVRIVVRPWERGVIIQVSETVIAEGLEPGEVQILEAIIVRALRAIQ